MEYEELLNVVAEGKKPACELPLRPDTIHAAGLLGLEIRCSPRSAGLFSRSDRLASEFVEGATEYFADLLPESVLGEYAQMVRCDHPAEALRIIRWHMAGMYGWSSGFAACHVIIGLLFGYPRCCIRYFIENLSRDVAAGRKQAPQQGKGFEYLRCERCRREDIQAAWCNAHNSSDVPQTARFHGLFDAAMRRCCEKLCKEREDVIELLKTADARAHDALRFCLAQAVALSAVASGISAKAIYLFGSCAKGEAGPGSDIDMLVLTDETHKTPKTLDAIAKALARYYGELLPALPSLLLDYKLATSKDLAEGANFTACITNVYEPSIQLWSAAMNA
jgi:predicted nucleotidyltransferase